MALPAVGLPAVAQPARDPREEEGAPSDNLYVSGLPSEFDSNSVQQFFGAIGNVVQCKSFGNGYALVRFSSTDEATNVKTSLTGQKPVGCAQPLRLTYAQSSEKKDWVCPRCGDLQFQKNTQCRLCGCPRPQGAGPGEAGVATPGAADGATEGGDWVCKQCGDLQFKKNIMCRLCGAPSPGAEGTVLAPQNLAMLPSFGKAAKGKGKVGGSSPYGGGKGKGIKDGPKCSVQDFIDELIVGGLPGGDYNPEVNCVYVGGLPKDTTTKHMYEIFAAFGSIPPRGTRVDTSLEGECSGFGFVNFNEAASAEMAVMALNGIVLNDGQTFEVRMNA